MAYVVSARKYRPQTFEELIGQEHVANTLRNAILKQRIGHAYLFSGPRGIGKTSAARIFAKALNCEKGPTPTPCGECTFCREISEGRSLDLVEIDGASNRRIDEIRQLRENVRFVPSSSRYKIYIIDEVHMLTPEAFNALLKTLEEPPEHIIFIFATTEVQKVPQTIRSRCQQFLFKRIPIPRIIDVLKRIMQDLTVRAEERALFWIAKCAAGSMRDAESILDQMISYSEGVIKTEDVFYVLGMPGYEIYHDFGGLISQGDFKSSFRLVDKLIRNGIEIPFLISGMIEYFKNLYVLSVDQNAEELIDLPKEDIDAMRKLLSSFNSEDVSNLLTLLSRVYLDTRNSELSKELFEITLIKMTNYKQIIDPAQLVQKLEEIKEDFEEKNLSRAKKENFDTTASSTEGIVEDEAVQMSTSDQEKVADKIIQHFSRKRMALAEFLKRASSYTLENNLLTIAYERGEKLSFEHIQEASAKRYIEKELREFLQKDIHLNVIITGGKKSLPTEETIPEDVSKVMKIFKGEIVSNSNNASRKNSG
jgi:DNA polymerase-3 subunit gamma/tau